ncbi:hypothetical protein GPM19_13045 [Halomonas sp. ZH2S]|uniref:Uncharacterized protein n=1 Tax=Vreelandella zhuhanensis TaxID=2684210 RepID=A0A7X3KRQ9_9GAMM|nr:hypothetical protein [Halomonas zhuhanensis]MWJ29113.1 hypothetical protein [Halomonas zhuhanensis]
MGRRDQGPYMVFGMDFPEQPLFDLYVLAERAIRVYSLAVAPPASIVDIDDHPRGNMGSLNANGYTMKVYPI